MPSEVAGTETTVDHVTLQFLAYGSTTSPTIHPTPTTTITMLTMLTIDHFAIYLVCTIFAGFAVLLGVALLDWLAGTD